MKKYSLAIFAILMSVAAYAIEKIPGQIISGSQPMEVTFLVPVGLFGGEPDIERMQRGIRYIDANGKKRKLKPGQATEFQFNYNNQTYRMVSQLYASDMFSSTSFMLLLIDGPVRMFEHRYTQRQSTGPNGMGMTTQTVIYLLQKGSDPLYQPRLLGFRKDMAKYFADCPKLVSLIEGKEFRRNDLDEIVAYYNNNCN